MGVGGGRALAGRARLSTWAARRGPGAEGALWTSQPEGGGLWTLRESRGWLGRLAGPVGAGAREKSGGCADLLPSLSFQARPWEAGGRGCATRVCISGERPAASLGGCWWRPSALSLPLIYNCP